VLPLERPVKAGSPVRLIGVNDVLRSPTHPAKAVLGFSLVLAAFGCGRAKPLAAEPVEPDAAAPTIDASMDVETATEVGTNVEGGSSIPEAAVPRQRAVAIGIALGKKHACALLDDHRVKCWGSNIVGQLGYGDKIDRGNLPSEMGDALPEVDLGTARTATALAAGSYHTCALFDDGAVKCWGITGRLGVPGTEAQGNVGDDPGEMGDALPRLDFGPSRKAVMLAAGQTTTCVLLDDGAVSCWGLASPGEPPAVVPLASAVKVHALLGGSFGVFALLDDGDLLGELPGRPSRSELLPQGQTAISAGGTDGAKCAVLSNGTAVCGFNSPPLALPPRLVGIGVTRLSGRCGLLSDGRVVCTGPLGDGYKCPRDPDEGALGFTLPLDRPAASLANGGDLAMCALLVDGAVRCWTSSGPADAPPAEPLISPTFDGTQAGCARWRDIDLGTRP
jgi:hypothetical protein